VARRKRLLSLQDNLAIAVLAGGLMAAAAILYIKLRPLEMSVWIVASSMLGGALALLAVRWFLTRVSESSVSFEIDRRLGLEDRIASADPIIRRGGPRRAVEEALLDDAAGRISGVDEASVVPYRFPGWYAISFVGVIALAMALVLPQRALPESESLLAEKVDIESAGEQLEQSAKEIEEFVPPETVTASLAKEQAELGRALKRSADTRAEALKRLAELEGRIRQRHDELEETKADEIVSLAEKRLRSAVAPAPKEAKKKTEADIESQSEETARKEEDSQTGDAQLKDSQASSKETVKESAKQSSDQQVPVEPRASDKAPASTAEGKDSKDAQAATQPVADEAKKTAQTEGRTGGRTEGQPQPQGQSREQEGKASDPSLTQPPANPGSPSSTPEAMTGEQQQEGQQKPEENQGPSNPLSSMMAEQAARAVPSMSQELLKKAEQLRAGDLKPEDIRQLAKAAESLARDLAPMAQSKEFQQALQQLASQVNPEQLERVARELMSQENIMRELEAAARLLAQNRQAREIAAGLARQFGQNENRAPDQPGRRQPGGSPGERDRAEGTGSQNAGRGDGIGRGSPKGQERLPGESKILGEGREDKLNGRLQKKDGGEYLFLQSRPEVGAARVPYSSAYPRYRREAERSVERSQIPPNMRKVVRSYFDAINPDAGKKR
jgi:hypothetical protein